MTVFSIVEDLVGHINELLSNDVVDSQAQNTNCIIRALQFLLIVLQLHGQELIILSIFLDFFHECVLTVY
jgi:hypothetical protein